MKKILGIILIFNCCLSCNRSAVPAHSEVNYGRFDIDTDLLLLHYDCKTDADDLHSIAAFGSLIHLDRYADVDYHAVAGSYGIQEGSYIPPNILFDAAYKDHWSDAHADIEVALDEVYAKALAVLDQNQGDIWIAEAGQSDFSAHLVARLREAKPSLNTTQRIHIVQHSDWNEKMTRKENLDYVKQYTDYHKIADGNATDNDTPGYNSETPILWYKILEDEEVLSLWRLAVTLADKYNGVDDRYNNKSIESGGLDFSDFSEVQWIFQIPNIDDCSQYFRYIQQHI